MFAGEGDEEFVMAVGAADAGEAVVQVAALEELVDGLVNDRPPVAELTSVAVGVEGAEVVEVFSDQAVKVGLQRLPGAVDGRRFVEHARQGGPPKPMGRASLRGRLFAIC